MCADECVCVYGGGVSDRQEGERGWRGGNFSAGARTAFGVLLEGHPFSVRVYLLHILFISVCADWESSAFKQLRHVPPRATGKRCRLRWLLTGAKIIKGNTIIWLDSQSLGSRGPGGVHARHKINEQKATDTRTSRLSTDKITHTPAGKVTPRSSPSFIYSRRSPGRHSSGSPEEAQK